MRPHTPRPASIPSLVADLVASLITIGALSGCATFDCATPVGNPRLTPTQVSAGPGATGGPTAGHIGELVRWGGTLVGAHNLRDSTEFEVVSYPLDGCGVPQLGPASTGRFIVEVPGFLEVADYRPNRLVTATGMIIATRAGEVGAAPYQFPVLSNGKVRLWPNALPDDYGYGYGVVRPWVGIGIGSGGWYGGRTGGWWGGGIGFPF